MWTGKSFALLRCGCPGSAAVRCMPRPTMRCSPALPLIWMYSPLPIHLQWVHKKKKTEA